MLESAEVNVMPEEFCSAAVRRDDQRLAPFFGAPDAPDHEAKWAAVMSSAMLVAAECLTLDHGEGGYQD